MTLGKIMKQLRKETFLSQEQLAAKLNITAQQSQNGRMKNLIQIFYSCQKSLRYLASRFDELFDYQAESAYQQIESMLEKERYFTNTEFTKSENFLLEQLSTNPNDLHALTLLGDLYHEYALKLDEKAAAYTKQALA